MATDAMHHKHHETLGRGQGIADAGKWGTDLEQTAMRASRQKQCEQQREFAK
jgi:hypothetical protein